MMLVQRQPRLPNIQAPSYCDCHRGVVDREMSSLECRWQAIKSLTRIMQDSNDLSEATNEPSEGISSDVNALLCLVSYLYCPLWAAREDFETLRQQNYRSVISTDAARRQAARLRGLTESWDRLCHLILLAFENLAVRLGSFRRIPPTSISSPDTGGITLYRRSSTAPASSC